jgi:hypothetical protein
MSTPDFGFVEDLEQGFVTELPAQVKGRVLHIDGDILAYLCAGNDDTPFAIARRNLFQRIENVRIFAGAERAITHITGARSDKGKRYEIAKTAPYQAQRTHSQRPKNWQGLREVMEERALDGYDFIEWDDREADDAMSVFSWEAYREGKQDLCVITSNDKDLRQLGGLCLDWNTNLLFERKHEHHVLNIDKFDFSKGTLKQGALFDGVWFLLFQMLKGDDVDNIPALDKVKGTWLMQHLPQECSKDALAGKSEQKDKSCGASLAAKILGTIPSAYPSKGYNLIKDIYKEHFGDTWQDYFKEQWQLLCLYYGQDDQRLNLARDIRDGVFDVRK